MGAADQWPLVTLEKEYKASMLQLNLIPLNYVPCQVFLEETYGGNIREIELLLDAFSLDGVPKEQGITATGEPN